MTDDSGAADFRDVLQRHGFTPVKAELWSEFVHQVVQVLRQAADELRRSDNWEAFKQKPGALGAPRARRRRQVVERPPLEDALTSELGHFVRQIRTALPPGHFLRRNEVTFCPEHLVYSETRAGRHSRKVDFLIYAAAGDEPPEFAIEAKPIHAQGDITGRYLAEEGLGCFFTTDSPYTREPVAGMLAYTINSQGRSWRAEISAAVTTYLPAPLSLDEIALPGTVESLTCSRHERIALSLEPVAVVHLEMIFEPEGEPQGPDS